MLNKRISWLAALTPNANVWHDVLQFFSACYFYNIYDDLGVSLEPRSPFWETASSQFKICEAIALFWFGAHALEKPTQWLGKILAKVILDFK